MRNICSVSGCEDFVVSKGLCDKHRKRLLRHGHVRLIRASDWGSREKHPLYGTWHQIKRTRTRSSICEEWIEDFWSFVRDVGEKPGEKFSLRLIDPNEQYCKKNCEWKERTITKRNDETTKQYRARYQRVHRAINPEKHHGYSLKKTYKITREIFVNLFKKQGGVCAICGNAELRINPHTRKPRNMAIDHCHNTGTIRGLLCTDCNTAIGLMKDSVENLQRAIDYLSNPC